MATPTIVGLPQESTGPPAAMPHLLSRELQQLCSGVLNALVKIHRLVPWLTGRSGSGLRAASSFGAFAPILMLLGREPQLLLAVRFQLDLEAMRTLIQLPHATEPSLQLCRHIGHT